MADRRDDPNTFDPRFDPAFQPGYDPRKEPPVVSRGAVDARPPTPGLEVPAAPITLAQSAGAPASGAPGAGGPPPPHARPAVDGGTLAHDGAAGDAAGHPSDPPPVVGANPFVVVLWALSALFVIVGFGLLRWIQTSSDMQTVASSYYIVLSVQFGAPMLIILGLATATGLLFLQAVTWRRRAAR